MPYRAVPIIQLNYTTPCLNIVQLINYSIQHYTYEENKFEVKPMMNLTNQTIKSIFEEKVVDALAGGISFSLKIGTGGV